MSLSILEIKSCPQYQLLRANVEDAKQSIFSVFNDLLSYFSSVCFNETAIIELVFLKTAESQPRLLLTLRNGEGCTTVPVKQIVNSLSDYLTHSKFVVSELKDQDFSDVVNEMRSQLAGKIITLTKAEKTTSSSISYSGYYYYTDTFDVESTQKKDTHNYNSTFQQLSSYDNALVAFQFIPTAFKQEELFALNSLKTELTTTSQGVFLNHQMIRESTVLDPLKSYSYYVDRASKPLFVGNIIIASNTNDINALTSALNTDIQSSFNKPISLSGFELSDTRRLSSDFYNFPKNIYNELLINYRNVSIWNGTVYQPTNLFRLPFLYTVEEASVFFKLPIDDGKIFGINSTRIANDNEILSNKVSAKENIQLGALIDSFKTNIGIASEEFTRHALIVGTPGSGKTTFALNLLLQFYEKGIPFLAIEPTKTEYRALIDKIPNLQIFTPGNSSVIPFIINPFIPPKGIKLEQYIPSLMNAFRAAFSMESPLDVLFLRAIRQCYSQYGWKNNSQCDDKDVQPFGLYEFILVFKRLIATSSYKSDTKANIETGGTFRLLNLIDQNKYIYDTVNTIKIEELLEKPTVLELNAIADDEQKALIMALLLIGICLYTKNKGSTTGEIKNLIMIDEAHVLLNNSGKNTSEFDKAQNTTVKSLQKMIAEIRSYGTGIIIADQAPSKVTSDIVANTDLKVGFRIVEKSERDIVANSMNLSEQQYQHMARLKKGEAIVYYSDLDTPKIIYTPDVRYKNGIRHFVPDEEIKNSIHYWDDNQELLMPYYECTLCQQCVSCKKCNLSVREKADYYSSHLIASIGTRIKDKDTLIKYMYRLHELVIRYEMDESNSTSLKLLCNCTKIQFLRSILLENSIPFTRSDSNALLEKTLIREVSEND